MRQRLSCLLHQRLLYRMCQRLSLLQRYLLRLSLLRLSLLHLSLPNLPLLIPCQNCRPRRRPNLPLPHL